MAITGVSAISGQQIIAAGAVSAKTAATAEYTTGGGSIQGLYNTVNTNSASWDSDPAVFPANIDTGNNTIAVVTTGFQDNTATRPTLFISGTTATSNYPRMLLSENHAAAQTSKSGAFLADAFEFYTGKNGGSTKVLRIDSTGMSGNVGFLFNKAHYDMWNKYSAESGNYYTTGNPSGFITGVDLTPYQTTADMTAYQEAGNYMSANALDSLSGNWETVTDKLDITAFSDVSGGFLTTAEATNFYTTANESGFITGVDLTPYQTTAGMTAYQPAGDYLTTADSSEFYTTGNESGFITGVPAGTMNESEFDYDASDNITGYNGSAFKAGDEFPQSATEAIEVVTSNSADWNGTTDTVSSNSGAWGGDALPISAGPGIKVELTDGKLLFSTDETVLWSGSNFTGNLSESIENFNEIKVNYITDDGIQGTEEFLPSIGKTITLDSMYVATNSAVWFKATNYTFSANTSFESYPMQLYVNNSRISGAWYNNTDNAAFRLTRVIGINRTAGGN